MDNPRIPNESQIHREREANYLRDIQRMATQGHAWIEANPQADVQIQWNFKPEVMVIGEIAAAIETGAISVNEPARAFLEAMVAGFPGEREPTVFMAQVAINTMSRAVPNNSFTRKIRRLSVPQMKALLHESEGRDWTEDSETNTLRTLVWQTVPEAEVDKLFAPDGNS